MITRALILAAGRGVPIGEDGVPNCLTRVGSANGDPLFEVRDGGVGQFASRRHFELRVGIAYRFEEFSSDDDSVKPRACIQRQSAHWSFGRGVMTAVTFLHEHGTNFLFEKLGVGRLSPAQG